MVTTLQLLAKLADKSEKEVQTPDAVLTPEELRVVEQCDEIARNKTYTAEQKLKLAIPLLRPYINQPLEIFKLCAISPAIKVLCHSDSTLTAGWGNFLSKKHVPGGEAVKIKSTIGKEKTFEHGGKIPSVDGKKNSGLYVVDSFIAGGLFSVYTNNKDPLFLDYVCEQGYYAALRERCDRTREKIKDCVNSPQERNLNADFKSLSDDLTKLSNLYWSVGHLDAAAIWSDMGTAYADAINVDSDNSYWAETFCQAAAENIYCAEILYGNKISQHIAQDIYGHKGGLQEVYGFKNWNDGVDNVLNLLKLPPTELINLKIKLKGQAENNIHKLQENDASSSLRS